MVTFGYLSLNAAIQASIAADWAVEPAPAMVPLSLVLLSSGAALEDSVADGLLSPVTIGSSSSEEQALSPTSSTVATVAAASLRGRRVVVRRDIKGASASFKSAGRRTGGRRSRAGGPVPDPSERARPERQMNGG